MRRAARGVLALLLASACKEREGSLPGVRAELRPVALQEAPGPPPLYDAQGRLLGSGVHVDWLEIPRGFTQVAKAAKGSSSFEARDLAPEHVRAFLSAQMLTGAVQEVGRGAVYRGVMPPDGRADAIRMDVELLVAPKGELLLLITPVTFPHVPMAPESEVKKELAQDLRRAE